MTQKWMCTSRISVTRTERVSHTSEERGSVGAFSFYFTLLQCAINLFDCLVRLANTSLVPFLPVLELVSLPSHLPPYPAPSSDAR